MTYGVFNSTIEKKLNELFSAILIEQRKFSHVVPSSSSNNELLQNSILEYTNNRGIGFYFPYLSTGRGHGPFTELVDGSVKYDLISGMGINLLGHSHPLTIRAHLEASTYDTMICGNLLPYALQADLVQTLINYVSKSQLRHFWFAGSGSVANDIALKIIWQKSEKRKRLIAFEKGFAGRTVAAHDLTWNSEYREGMPALVEVSFIPHFDHNNPDQSTKRTLEALNKAYSQYPEQFCAIILELVQGEAGFVYGNQTFYNEICKWAKERKIFIWIDEVQTFCRTGELFAFQTFNLDKYVDVVTIGKTLQCCGVFFSSHLNPKPGLIGGTFAAPISSINFAIKMLNLLSKGNFFGETGRMKEIEKKFLMKFEKLKHPSIQKPRGIGSMTSFQVCNGSKEVTWDFLSRLFHNGVIAFSAGKNPMRVRFLLPITLTDQHIDEIFKIIENTLNEISTQ